MIKSAKKLVFAALTTLMVWLLATGALAQTGAGRPQLGATAPPPMLELVTSSGQPLAGIELVWQNNSYIGEFSVKNAGGSPLSVTRIAVRASELPHVPQGITATFDNSQVQAVIQPGGTKRATVRWAPPRFPGFNELYGHVLIDSDTPSHQAVAVGIHAERKISPSFIFNHVLSWLVFLPLLGALVMLGLHLAGHKKNEHLKWVGIGLTGVELLGAIWLCASYNRDISRLAGNDGLQFIEHGVLLRSCNVEYFAGVDGTSISMVLLSALVAFVAAIASFGMKTKLKAYWAMFFLLMTGLIGVFVSLDLVMFYLFWELMLLAMYLLIGIWGGSRKQHATIKFLVYTAASSLLMLFAFMALYRNSDPSFLADGTAVRHTFSIPELARIDYLGKNLTICGFSFVKVVWLALFAGFAVMLPMFPLHTWLPAVQAEVPTAISVLLAGVILKTGAYGMLRLNFSLLPEATQWAAPAIAVLGVVNILYGAFCAMAQEDLKRLVAYASISQMGFCLLGMAALTPHGIEGAIVQMFNHGTISAMLFVLIGVIYDRAGTRDLGRFGGLATQMPVYAAFAGFAFMASLGLPGLSGFIGELLVVVGAFPIFPVVAIIAVGGVIVTASYHLWAFQRVFLGKLPRSWAASPELASSGGKFPEISFREVASLVPMVVVVLVLGFWPRPLLELINSGVLDLRDLVIPQVGSQIASVQDESARLIAMIW